MRLSDRQYDCRAKMITFPDTHVRLEVQRHESANVITESVEHLLRVCRLNNFRRAVVVSKCEESVCYAALRKSVRYFGNMAPMRLALVFPHVKTSLPWNALYSETRSPLFVGWDARRRGARGENPLVFCEGLPMPWPSEQAAFGERDSRRTGHDEMIEHLHIHQGKRFLEVPGEKLVRLARLRHPRRVIVGKDYGGCICL